MKRIDLTKEQILLAMRMTKSNKAAARYLGVSYMLYKKWAKFYHEFEGGRSLFDTHKNQSGKGIPKHMVASKRNKWAIEDVMNGVISSTHFSPTVLKNRLIQEGYLKEECSICGMHERRLSDYKMPLILNFKDGNAKHYHQDNIRLLCYNCYFMNVDDVFNEKDLYQLETHISVFRTTDAVDLELDDYQKQRLAELGLYEPPKPDDGSEYISKF